MPANDIWPGRDDELFYPQDARGSGRRAPPRRKRGGVLRWLFFLLVISGGAGAGYMWLVLPKAQQLHLTSRLLTQATESTAALQARIKSLEVESQKGAAATEALGQQLAAATAKGSWLQAAKDQLTQTLAPLADQRHLQLLPHEQGLAIHLPITEAAEAPAATLAPRAPLVRSIGKALAAFAASHPGHGVVTAFACGPRRAAPPASVPAHSASGRRHRRVRTAPATPTPTDPALEAATLARDLAALLVEPLASASDLRLTAAWGEPAWGWSVPGDDVATPLPQCLVIDLRQGA